MSTTSTPVRARVEKIAEVTPGRSLPVSVMSRVSGVSIASEVIAGPTTVGGRVHARAMDATTAMTRYADTIAARDWAGLAALLAPDVAVRLLHTGEVFDRDGFVALNRDYPGPWTFTREQVTGAGESAALRARVTSGATTYHLAAFGTVAAGLLTEVVEVWTDGVGEAGPEPQHHGIDYVEVPVPDLEAAERFYGEAFGWRFRRYGPSYAAILAPSGRGEVGGLAATGEPGASTSPGRPLVLLHSADLDATLAAVRAAGGTVVREPYAFPGGRRFHLTDPGGTEIGVWGR
ncbi:hypothetical protein GGQ22_05910 [Nocardioides sp. zg-579]|uniref:VOC domain-containing protein n=2 Tax=Nocardioides marmotae TaxID=2663857 RepID=A0A6I3J0U4_9ACTN|nr:hypothetical protein [Gordonia jinghuaiqii]MTB94611.1 hypothetical protein [Nocardioides marmotae]